MLDLTIWLIDLTINIFLSTNASYLTHSQDWRLSSTEFDNTCECETVSDNKEQALVIIMSQTNFICPSSCIDFFVCPNGTKFACCKDGIYELASTGKSFSEALILA